MLIGAIEVCSFGLRVWIGVAWDSFPLENRFGVRLCVGARFPAFEFRVGSCMRVWKGWDMFDDVRGAGVVGDIDFFLLWRSF